MDLKQDVIYRDFKLNDSAIRDSIVPGSQAGAGISGCVIDSVDMSDVDVIQFLEKRSLQDGMDAGDVYLGARRIRMAGTLYGNSRAILYDNLQDLRNALSPTLAYREEPSEKGYRPLYFAVPTNDAENWPELAIEQRVLALPRGISYTVLRKSTGGEDGQGLAIPWQAILVCRDPSIYAVTEQEVVFQDTVNAAGNFENRGSYHAPLNMLFEVTSASGTITVTAGGSTFTLTIPGSTGTRIVRVKGVDKIVTIEEDSVEALRMEVISFSGQSTWPLIDTGTSAYSVVFGGTINLTDSTSSRMWFWEQWA